MTKLVAGPFVTNTRPSWIAIGDGAAYLCAATKDQPQAECVQLGNLKGKNIDVGITRVGLAPYLRISSTSLSNEYINDFAAEFKNALQIASKYLRHLPNAESLVNLRSSSGAATVMANKLGDGVVGNGGLALIQIGDVGAAVQSVKAYNAQKPQSKSGGLISPMGCVPEVVIDADGNSSIIVCGTTDPTNPGGDGPYYPTDPGYPPGGEPPWIRRRRGKIQ